MRKAEARKLHSELQKDIEHYIIYNRFQKIPTNEINEIVNDKIYCQQNMKEVVYAHLDILVCNFK
jgi:hypothetical protein